MSEFFKLKKELFVVTFGFFLQTAQMSRGQTLIVACSSVPDYPIVRNRKPL